MSNNISKIIITLSLLLFILVIIPSSFAIDEDTNTTSESIELEFNDDSDILDASGNDYYFDASVERDGDGTINNPYKTLTANRIKANSNIHLANGEYTLDKRKEITNVNFIGSDPEKTIISYNGIGFNVQTSLSLINVTLKNLVINNNYRVTAVNTTFEGGTGVTADSYGNNFGGAIYAPYNQYYTTSVDLTKCTFINNHAEYGGAIYMDTGYLTVKDCLFINNTAFNYGGVIALEYESQVSISKSKFINSSSSNDAGGAIYLKESTLTGTDLEFNNCSATFGGAITSLSSSVNLKSIKCKNNNAKWEGGAIYHMYGSFSISDSSFDNNTARNGGALFIDNSTSFTILKTIFSNNKAEFAAGGIYSLLNKLNRGTSIKDESLDNMFFDNVANLENDAYEVSTLNLNIGNGNYTLYKVNETTITSLPSYYSLIDEGYVTAVKDQQTSGNCWAYTAIAVLESCILKASGDNLDLSEEHMKNIIELYSDYGWKMNTNGGGYDMMPFGYYSSWLGPVFESDDLTDDKSTLSPILDSVMHVQNILFLKRNSYTDNDAIKEALMKYGAVGTGIYYDSGYQYGANYYYYGNSYQNHAVTIVGWDDNYSRNNFYGTPEGNGAWIVKNSWGPDWAKNGFFYVSYYDTRFAQIGDSEGSYTFILNDTVKFNKNYQYDIAGRTDYFYNASSKVWYKNVFKATDNEFLAAVSTTFEKLTNWDLSIYVNNVLQATKSGVSKPGYFTINLDNIIPLKIGDVFEVVFKIAVDGEAGFPVSEIASLNKKVYEKETSFVSYDGMNWKDLHNLKWSYSSHSYSSQVACIKAFTILDSLNTNTSLEIVYDRFNPVNITATVIDSYGNLVNSGNVTFNFNGKEYVVNVTNGIAQITHIFEKTTNEINATFNGVNYKTSSNATTVEIGVLDINLNVAIEKDLNKIIINVIANKKITDQADILINDKKYCISLIDGEGSLSLEEVDLGKYDVTVSLNNTEIYNSDAKSDSFTIDVITTRIMSSNLTTDDFSGESYSVKLVNKSGDAIANKNITFILNNETYNRITDSNGVASIPINLNGGEYSIITQFNGDEDYVASQATNMIKVKTKVNIDVATIQTINNIEIDITLNQTIDELVYIKVNDDEYSVAVSEGKGKLELHNLENNLYNITVGLNNDEDYIFSEVKTNFTINVNELKIISSDLNTSDYSNEEYVITLVDENNAPVVGKEIVFTLNGQITITKTDSNGNAKIGLNLKSGTYRIYANFDGDNEYFAANSINTVIVKDKVDVSVSVSKNANNALINIKLSKSIDESLEIIINNKTYNVKSVNGRALINLDDLENDNYTVIVKLVNTVKYISNIAYTNFTININDLQIISNDLNTVDYSNEDYSIKLLDNNNNPIANKTISFLLNSNRYVRTTDENGVASIPINLNVGSYDIKTTFNGDDDFFKNTVSNTINVKEGVGIKDVSINTDSNDINIGVTLTKDVSETVELEISGKKYSISTVNGKGSIVINLDDGNYSINANIDKYNFTKKLDINVNVGEYIKSNDFITYYQSGSEYIVTLLNNTKGVNGKTIIFTLNGVKFNKTTNNNGQASININLDVGEYKVTIYNPETGENKTQTIKVIKTITDNKDLVKYYKGGESYKVLVMGDNNKAVGAGEIVTMKINGNTIKVKTDSKGYATLKINYKPNKYTITVTYKKFTVTNKITVKNTLITKNISKKKGKTVQFTAKLVNTKGKVLKNKKIKFKIKGKTYKVKTNKKGIAKLKIKKGLKVGKNKITTSYGSYKVKNTITIKK